MCNASSVPQATPPQSSGDKSPHPQSVDENDPEASVTGHNDVFVDVIASNDSGVDEPATIYFQSHDVTTCPASSSVDAHVVNVTLAAESYSAASSAVAAADFGQAVGLASAGNGNESGQRSANDEIPRRLTDDNRDVGFQQTHITQLSSTTLNVAVVQSGIQSASQLPDESRQRCELDTFVAELPKEENV